MQAVKNASKLMVVIGIDREIEGLVIAFRGSDNVKNWILDDFRFYLQKLNDIPRCEGCRVHRGFY